MARTIIHPYKLASESAKVLAQALGYRRVAKNSKFKARAADTIINWGSTELRCSVKPQTTILNKPEAVENAANKVIAFQKFTQHGVPTFEWTTSKEQAYEYHLDGRTVYCRTLVKSCSGRGIVVIEPDNDITFAEFPNAGLYTIAVEGKRREWRLHVFQGNIIATQKKKRRHGFDHDRVNANFVRNLDSGWVFCTENVTASEQTQNAAILAVEALGLDFAGVDIITQGEEVYVVEVNTAVGLSSPTVISAYVESFN